MFKKVYLNNAMIMVSVYAVIIMKSELMLDEKN